MKIKLLKHNKILLFTTTSMFVAIGVLMPQVFHAIPNAATLLSPMHITVLLCGIICGGLMGSICGLLTPLLSFMIFGMPPFPYALVPMLFELCAYGLFAGIFMEVFSQIEKLKNINYLLALICSMILGRIIFVITRVLLFVMLSSEMTLGALIVTSLTNAFVNGWLGIIIQIVLIPSILLALKKARVLEKYDCEFAVNPPQQTK